jgi:hypothetical protein
MIEVRRTREQSYRFDADPSAALICRRPLRLRKAMSAQEYPVPSYKQSHDVSWDQRMQNYGPISKAVGRLSVSGWIMETRPLGRRTAETYGWGRYLSWQAPTRQGTLDPAGGCIERELIADTGTGHMGMSKMRTMDSNMLARLLALTLCSLLHGFGYPYPQARRYNCAAEPVRCLTQGERGGCAFPTFKKTAGCPPLLFRPAGPGV